MALNADKFGHLKVSFGDLAAMEAEIVRSISADERQLCIPLNMTKYVMAQSDGKLAKVINGADLVVADGVAIKWLARRIGYSQVHRVTGIDLAESLLALAKAKNWRLYFLGSRPENLQKALIEIKRRFDNPEIVGFRDGFFSDADIPKIVEDIKAARPDILFLGLGLPQKEYFVADNFADLDVRFCITVGGAIDIWAGTKKRAPALVQKAGLEWLYRSVYDLSRSGLIIRYGLSFIKDLIFPPDRKGN